MSDQPLAVPDTIDAFNAIQTPGAPVEAGSARLKKFSLPVVQHMRQAGLIANDEAQTALTVAKRINHALFANEPLDGIQELQKSFREKLAAAGGDISKLAEGGAQSPLAKLVDAYLAARVAHYEKSIHALKDVAHPDMGSFEMGTIIAEATKKAEQYEGERRAYAGMPELINSTAAKYPQLFDRYRNIGEILEASGLAQGDTATVKERIDDVMAEVAGVRLLDVAPSIMGLRKTTLEGYAQYPDEYRTAIVYAAEDTALHTTGLERLNLYDTPKATPQLKQIQAISSLLSASLHTLTSHNHNSDGTTNPPIGELANNLVQAREFVRAGQMAGASLVHNYIDSGASATDAKMQSLDDSFTALAEKRQVALVDTNAAQGAAKEVGAKLAGFLRVKFAGRADLLAKVDTLEALATTPPALETGFAARAGQPPATFAAGVVNGASVAPIR